MTAGTAVAVPALLAGLCDDAAVFPPGNLSLADALPAHRAHRASGHAGLVGPFVVSAASLPELAGLLEGEPPRSLDVSVTVPEPAAVSTALAAVDRIAALRVSSIEVAVPEHVATGEVAATLDAALARRHGVTAFVELPRDGRRPDLIRSLSGTAYLAKLRTGGVRAELHPDEGELAAAVVATVRARLSFKATAGLHHAVRNTDPATGFEQHGFLNLLTAVDAAIAGAGEAEVAQLLADRTPDVVAARARAVAERASPVRERFRSIGTCSIVEPLEELAALGLLGHPDHHGGDPR
jgi:hypothetical protein